MRHASTKALYAYWTELLHHEPGRDRPFWPDRADIEPAAIRNWLGDVFILQSGEADQEVTYRLAGTRLCEMHGRELAGMPFVTNFGGADQMNARSWLSTFGREACPLLLASVAENRTGDRVGLETLVLPLRHGEAPLQRRALGITTPSHNQPWVGLLPIERQELTSIRVLRPWETGIARSDWTMARPSSKSSNGRKERRDLPVGRKIAHLTVLEGGLARNEVHDR